ncbi:MAG: glycosyltransferase family 4 protein [Flavobacteriales bacterium]|nr:glycosyltransferase family 4 protein [Flavobacteriales bacterium]
MKIAVNTRLLLKGRLDGIGWYTYENFSRITRNHPEHEFHFFFDRPFDPEFIFSDNVVPHVIRPQARHPLLFRLWFDYAIPWAVKKCGAELFVSPDMIGSQRLSVPQLVVMHDLNFVHYPNDLSPSASRFWRTRTPVTAMMADRLVAVSDFTKSDLIQSYGISSGKIDVVHNAAGIAYQPVSAQQQSDTRIKYAQGLPYFIFVSSIHPRKNLQRVLQAFDDFRERYADRFKLVIVGRKFWDFPELDVVYAAMKHKEDVIFTGRMEQDELALLTASAAASLYVSYYEGFGIPVVEAMQSGTPVIFANTTALPEVAGNAGIAVDPFSVQEITQAMIEVVSNETLRSEVIARGLERAKSFSWDNSANLLWHSMMNCMNR